MRLWGCILMPGLNTLTQAYPPAIGSPRSHNSGSVQSQSRHLKVALVLRAWPKQKNNPQTTFQLMVFVKLNPFKKLHTYWRAVFSHEEKHLLHSLGEKAPSLDDYNYMSVSSCDLLEQLTSSFVFLIRLGRANRISLSENLGVTNQ